MDTLKGTTVGVVSLGCVKNLVDSEVILGLLGEAGCTITSDPRQAEVLIVNTCGFIAPAQRESVDTVLEMARLKQDGRLRALVVAGCLPRRFDAAEVAGRLPEVDAVVGTAEVPLISQVVARALAGERTVLAEPVPSFLYHERLPRLLTTPGHLAYVKISEGCDHPCTFCTIPRIRGRFQSRPMESIVTEVQALADQGVQEVVLVGQDTTLYGADRYGRLQLPQLLRQLAATGIPWIRLLYTYPAHVSEELLETMAELPQVCHYLDMPLQHAADRVLRAMKRWGDQSRYEALIATARQLMPDIALRTTFIVGFPGETEADLDTLLGFMDRVGFDHVGVFTYARELDTPAAALPDQVPQREKRRRRDVVLRHQRQRVEGYLARRLGRTMPVVLERHQDTPPAPALALRRQRQRVGRQSEVAWMVGRTALQAPEVDGVTYVALNGAARPGQRVTVRLEGVHGYDYLARVVSPDGDVVGTGADPMV